MTLSYLGVGAKSDVPRMSSSELLNVVTSAQDRNIVISSSSSSDGLCDVASAGLVDASTQRPFTSHVWRRRSADLPLQRPASEESMRVSNRRKGSIWDKTGILLIDRKRASAPRPIPLHTVSSSACLDKPGTRTSHCPNPCDHDEV